MFHRDSTIPVGSGVGESARVAKGTPGRCSESMVSSVEHGARIAMSLLDLVPGATLSVHDDVWDEALCSSVTVGACDSFVSLTSRLRFIEKKEGVVVCCLELFRRFRLGDKKVSPTKRTIL